MRKNPRAPKTPNPSRAQIKPQVDHVLNSARIHGGNRGVPEPIVRHGWRRGKVSTFNQITVLFVKLNSNTNTQE